ncbi:Coronin-like protein [Podosphaera aphanis]|nr:Coronin-like protein [Podosphaera aphanis]
MTGTLAILGCGNLGTAILSGILSSIDSPEESEKNEGESRPSKYIACVHRPESVERVENILGPRAKYVQIFQNQNRDAIAQADYIILACKPYAVEQILHSVRIELADKVLISICAGVTVSQIRSYLPASKEYHIIRAMPNIASSIHQSMTVIEKSDYILPAGTFSLVDWIFTKIGSVTHLPSSQLDTATALCGSGPAFFALILEAAIDGAVAMGMSRAEATLMAAQSMKGAAALVLTGEHPAVLKDKVSSPGRFVRASKYRHVFGKSTRKESCYDNLRISRNAWDTNLVKANPEYLAVNWEASGGGAFAVIPVNEKGRLPEQIPLFRGHTAPVLDTDWNPFNDRFIASGSDDGKVFIWQVPQDFTLYTDADEPVDIGPLSKLTGHSRKVGQVLFNPAAENILASASGDYTIKLWDVSTSKSHFTLKHGDIVQSLSWSANGVMLATTSRDKKLRVWDVRQERPAHEVQGHSGAKNSRVVWMGEHNRLATTGFSKMSDRQMALWDVGNPQEPIGGFTVLDSISGVCMPFWDDGTQCLYLAGKGDGNIRYFEYENDKFEFLSEYKSAEPQRGLAFVPRRGINVHENEIMRAYKTVNDSYIEPISFTVPRRAEVFQSDIYPPATGLKPALSAASWLAGQNGIPAKIDLESVYDGNAPVEVVVSEKPAINTVSAVPAPVLIQAASITPKNQPTPSAAPKASSSMAEQKDSISAMASKYQDPEISDEEPSSFDEVSKPAQKSIPAAAKQESNRTSPIVKTTPRPEPVSQPTPQAESHQILKAVSTPKEISADADSLKSSLDYIKNLLEAQTMTINSQSQQIGKLTQEVDILKTKIDSGTQDQSQQIRQLKLELEAAKS